MAPTILGTGADIEGTEGPDVVITNGAQEVTTLGGDDLVCITGSLTSYGLFDTGAGDDRVDSSAASNDQNLYIHLGPGADQFSGGSANEEVVLRWSSFSDFEFETVLRGPLSFVGSDAPELLMLLGQRLRWKADIRMRGVATTS